jgi:hypothetical protein
MSLMPQRRFESSQSESQKQRKTKLDPYNANAVSQFFEPLDEKGKIQRAGQ